jgi:hypothetical protein
MNKSLCIKLYRNNPNKYCGFTLIEIAIILFIMSLMLGNMVKGSTLVDNAKVKRLAEDFGNIPSYIYDYQNKFRALPGDDAVASIHVGGTTATTPIGKQGNGQIDGPWNSLVRTDESYLFWQHVRLAGLAPGSVVIIPATPAIGDGYTPVNAVGGQIGIQSNNSSFTTITLNASDIASTFTGSYILCSQGILGKYAKQLDTMMDDGNTDTGSMRVNDPAVPGKSVATANISDSRLYIVCMGI